MPEEGQATTVGAVVETPAAPATTVAPESFVGTDGVFAEDWQSKLQDESLRGDQTLKTLKNVESLAKSYVHVRKQVPLDKIAIPGANATEQELSAFHKALGRPLTAEEYQIAMVAIRLHPAANNDRLVHMIGANNSTIMSSLEHIEFFHIVFIHDFLEFMNKPWVIQ